ncbi:helix-turn-helix domain-containing protein [Kribbella sp. DT2]|uniref:helix-turn-helix domain-containing protein n=1 Tax=Kribbella sp. DT2 TaxID=3393427 RepID=UPI003CF6253A
MAAKKSVSAVRKVRAKKLAGSAARRHGSGHDAASGLAATAPTRTKRRRKPAEESGHKPPAQLAGASRRGALLMPIASPPRDRLRELEMIVARGGEITIVEGQSSLKVDGQTLAAIRQILAALSSGSVTLVLGNTRDTELTSQEVADLLNVSRPHVVKLAREGKLSHKMVGNRHRFLLSDVQEHGRRHRLEREQALTAMVPGDGYDPADF